MATVYVNGTDFILDTDPKRPGVYTVAGVQAAQAAMKAAGVESVSIRDNEGDPSGETLPVEFDPQVLALATVLDCSPLGCEPTHSGSDVWESEDEPGEYRVLTACEREQAADEALESYIDECIIEQAKAEARDNAALASLIRTLTEYFDRKAWKEHAIDCDGYGHTLSTYDGEENEAYINGEWYYVYRVN